MQLPLFKGDVISISMSCAHAVFEACQHLQMGERNGDLSCFPSWFGCSLLNSCNDAVLGISLEENGGENRINTRVL